ncbi:MAG: penicillin-binding protein activator [Gallionellaceae bacterium]
MMSKLKLFLQSGQKWKIFGLILISIVVLGTLLSLLTKMTFIRDDEATRPRIAAVGPMTGSQAELGLAIKQGVELYVETINKQGGKNGRLVEVMVVDETAQAAQTIAADSRVVGVVGYVSPQLLREAAPLLQSKKINIITPQYQAETLPGVISLGLDTKEQARFAANYARNVVQQRLMYVVRETGPEFDPLVEPFMDVYKRFDTPVQKVWNISPAENTEAQVSKILNDIKEIDIGAIYLAANPELSARLVQGIRATGNALEIFGPEQLATAAFRTSMQTLTGKNAAMQIHGIVSATPVLFDTANDEAQKFQTRYQQRFNSSPDWLATLCFDAVKVALSAKPGEDEVKGLSGLFRFDHYQAQLPIQVGIYNGDRIISAPVQLLPIAKGASFNYIEALRQGRVLYVNDRFMFKTNVVYTGVRLNEISDLDLQKETATLDMSIWFRYRGNFNPQELLIDNSVEPVKFDTPEESKSGDEVQYRRYRIKQKFRLNFTDAKRAYGQHIAGISFRHHQLNRSNLIYVVDVLGMPTGNDLVNELLRQKVVNPSTGWEMDNAWLSQELVSEQSDGAPQYVGLTGEQPQFSNITLGVLLKPASANARDVIQAEYFIYIAIFGLLGSVFALILDRRNLNRYWAVQAWLLRVIFWPLILLSVGNIVLDHAFTHFTQSTTRTLVNVYESLWWIIGAWLIDIAIRRFIWFGLEESTQRKVPNVIKFFTSFILFALAFAGVVAFVFNQTLTSLLATSGVLAMVIGLAVQANIANVFSGIVLNIERPFRVGDYIKINNTLGQVMDITWRTTRIESNDGQMVSLANSKVSEAEMQNFSTTPHGIAAETVFHLNPDIDPSIVMGIVSDAVNESKSIYLKDDPMYAPMVRFKGIVCDNGYWVAEYSVGYRVKILPKKSKAKEELWTYLRQQFKARDFELCPPSLARIQGNTSPEKLISQK